MRPGKTGRTVEAHKFNVLIDWVDGQVADTDEIAVDAETREDAVLFALARWREEFCADYQHCLLTGISFVEVADEEGVDTSLTQGTSVHHDAPRFAVDDLLTAPRPVGADRETLRLYPSRLGEYFGPGADPR